MIRNITDQRISELRRQLVAAENLCQSGQDRNGAYTSLIDVTKRELESLEQRRRTAADSRITTPPVRPADRASPLSSPTG